MKKKVCLLSALVGICGSFHEAYAAPAEDTSRYVYEAAVKESLYGLESLLTGNANDEYGTEQGLQQLKQAVAGFRRLRLDSKRIQSLNHDWLRIYTVSAYGKVKGGWQLVHVHTLRCPVERKHHWAEMFMDSLEDSSRRMVTIEHCLVTEIR